MLKNTLSDCKTHLALCQARKRVIEQSCIVHKNGVYLHHKYTMARQSISLNEPNDLWLQQQVHTKEYSSKSEVINDLIRQERFRQQQLDDLRTRLILAEQSGYTKENKNEILLAAKSQNGNL